MKSLTNYVYAHDETISTITGTAGDDKLRGTKLDDLIEGGAGRDQLSGGRGNDILFGGGGGDWLSGGFGDDVIVGGSGNDKLRGGRGSDVFVFEDGAGKDQIVDFEIGVDLIDFRSHVSVESIDDLELSVMRSGVLITFDGGWLELKHLSVSDIDPGMFLF